MYGNLTCDTVILPLAKNMCMTNQGVYYSTKISSLVLVKLVWHIFQPLHLYALSPLKLADFYCACIVPHFMNNLYIIIRIIDYVPHLMKNLYIVIRIIDYVSPSLIALSYPKVHNSLTGKANLHFFTFTSKVGT